MTHPVRDAAHRDGLSHSIPHATAEQVVEAALDLLLEKQARARGLVKKPRTKTQTVASPAAATATSTPTAAPKATPTLDPWGPRHRRSGPREYVPAATRRAVMERDQACCSWPLDGGGVCGSTYRFEIDHLVPWAHFSLPTVDNSRVLCHPQQCPGSPAGLRGALHGSLLAPRRSPRRSFSPHGYNATVIPTLETPRLHLHPLTLDDAPAIQEHFARWEIVRHLANRVPWPYPPDGALTFVRDVALPAMARGEAWHWSLRLHESPDQLVGVATLQLGERENRGIWVGLPWQGRGIASEACRELERFWFEVLGFPVLRITKAVVNTASRQLSVSGGMRVIAAGEGEFVSGRLPEELWE